jgi:hypothetical protein
MMELAQLMGPVEVVEGEQCGKMKQKNWLVRLSQFVTLLLTLTQLNDNSIYRWSLPPPASVEVVDFKRAQKTSHTRCFRARLHFKKKREKCVTTHFPRYNDFHRQKMDRPARIFI